MAIHISKVGVRYSRLLILEDVGRTPLGAVLYKCRCDCGKEKVVKFYHLVDGSTKSCGCYSRDRSQTHGHNRVGKRSPEYTCWRNVITRCTNPNVSAYPDYGGRGITVCKRWRKFEKFLTDMGPMPKGYTIERRNNNRGYSPKNCYWLPRNKQSLNRRGNVMITVSGSKYCLTEACQILGISKNAVEYRIYECGILPQDAIDSLIIPTK